ncbi:MAG: TonB-dependent siderophore receptor [Porticoccaceae bacterium]
MNTSSHEREMSVRKSRMKPLVAAIICASYGALAQAQDASDRAAEGQDRSTKLQAVEVRGEYLRQTVSSEKFTAPLIDTPQTLQIIPQEVFAQQGAQTLTDVLNNTPGISFNAGENGFSTSNNNFSLRGFDTSGSIFIDGARDSGSYTRDIFNVEQVEVAKGPAADNGRGSGGGYINLVTKMPRLENATSATLSYGFDSYDSDPRQRASADINRILNESTAVRLNLMVEESGVAGRDEADKSAWGFAPSLSLGLNTPTRLHLSYQHVQDDGRPDWGTPAALISGMMRHDPLTGSSERDNFYGLASDFEDVTSDAFVISVEHDLSDSVTISNQTRWSRNDHQARYTVVTGYAPASQVVTTQTQFYDRETTTLTNLTNLNMRFATGQVGHNLVAGIEFSREESEADRFSGVNSTTDIFSPDFRRVEATPFAPTQTNDVGVDTLAAYVYDTMEFNESWQLTGGLRAERYEVAIDSHTIAGDPTGALSGYRDSETTLSGKIGLVYKPVENGSIYAAAGLATLPPGSFLSNPDISRTGDNAFPGFVASAKPQKSLNLEVGTKWNFYDERLGLSLAYFHTEKRDVAITGRDVGDTATTLKGYGKQIVEGVEFSINGQITEAWNIFAGFVILDSERDHSAYLDEVRRRANPADYGDVLRTSGDELAFTPKESASLWTTYSFPFGLTVGGGIQHVGDSWVGRPDDASRIIPNGTYGKLPDYTIANLMASYKVNPNVSMRLNVDNVTDELYANSANWPAQRVVLGPPRSYLLSVDFHF